MLLALKKYFDLENDILVFDNIDEMILKISTYLNNEDKRFKMIENAHRKVLKIYIR